MLSPAFQLLLRDRDSKVVDAWHQHFRGISNVDVSLGDIFDKRADAIVSPANSFGFMDGGIDLMYSRRFGWELQERLREELRMHSYGELPVGQALVIETYDPEIPFMVCAPTMRIPGDVSNTVNAYLSFRAALIAVKKFNESTGGTIKSLLSPGLCTAIGNMPADKSARQMSTAFATCFLGQENSPMTLGQAVQEHRRLID